MNRFSWKHLAAWCAVALVLALTTPLVWALDRPPWDKLTTKVGPDAEVPGWYINLGITGARAMIAEAEPKVLLVNPQDYAAAPRLSATAATALILTSKCKKLQLTGAHPITHKRP